MILVLQEDCQHQPVCHHQHVSLQTISSRPASAHLPAPVKTICWKKLLHEIQISSDSEEELSWPGTDSSILGPEHEPRHTHDTSIKLLQCQQQQLGQVQCSSPQLLPELSSSSHHRQSPVQLPQPHPHCSSQLSRHTHHSQVIQLPLASLLILPRQECCRVSSVQWRHLPAAHDAALPLPHDHTILLHQLLLPCAAHLQR